MTAVRAAIVAALLSAATAGCTLLGARPQVGPAEVSAPATNVTADALLEKLDDRARAIQSFRALAAMKYADARQKLAVKEVVVVERPDRIRIEVMGAFGVALQIVSDGETLRAYNRGERTFYSGKATVENFARFTRLELGLGDVADLLLGLPPTRSRAGRATLRFDAPEGFWRVATRSDAGDTTTVWFDPDTLRPSKSTEVDRRGRVKYAASYYDYQTVGGVDFPARVRFEIPAQEAQVELRYSNLSVNGALEPNLFQFDAPSGARIVDLDTLADPVAGVQP